MSTAEFPIVQSYSGACPNCRYVIPPLNEVSEAYFDRGFVTCSHCGSSLDLWKTTLERLTRRLPFVFAIGALGPITTHIEFELHANEGVELDLTEHRIPVGATVLAVIYNARGGNCFPIETHGNVPRRRFIGTTAYLYGLQMRTSDGLPIQEEFHGKNINAAVVWAPIGDSGAPWLYLVDAFEALSVGKLSQAIVPAHAAAEISINPVVRHILLQHAGQEIKELLTELLKQKLGFASVLNVVLPKLCPLLGAKTMPDEIRNELNTLRKLRNEFMHEGVLPSDIDEEQVRRLLCAGVFGFEYAKYLKHFLKP